MIPRYASTKAGTPLLVVKSQAVQLWCEMRPNQGDFGPTVTLDSDSVAFEWFHDKIK
jgi:hypothetical protein